MIATVARKEMKDMIRDGRFRWAGGIGCRCSSGRSRWDGSITAR
jgi:hypothetical protein